MLIPDWVWPALLDADVRINPLDAETVEVSNERSELKEPICMRLMNRTHLEPRDVKTLRTHVTRETPLLFIVPMISAATAEALADEGWSWIAASDRAPGRGRGVLWLPDAPVRLGEADEVQQPGRSPRPGRLPWGRLAVARALLTGFALTQHELVAICGISQPAVSMALKDLAGRGLVGVRDRASAARWEVTDFTTLLHEWLAVYPGPGGVSTYWYGLASLEEQTRDAVSLLHARAAPSVDGTGPVVSGDAAADLIAPYRRPIRAVIYAAPGADLAEVGLTAATPGEATLELRVPKDPLVWPSAPARRLLDVMKPSRPYELADPFQILYDMRHAPGADADQAAQRIEAVVSAAVASGPWRQ